MRLVLAAAAALALLIAPAAYACDCKDCPHAKAAAGGKADPKATGKDCCCHGGKECKCGPDCKCPHCTAKKAAEKKDEKKT